MAYSFAGAHLEYPTGTGTSSANPVQTSLQVPAGTKAFVLMLIWAPAGARDNTNDTPTFGGYSFTQIDTRRQASSSPEGSAEMWVLFNPPADQAYTLTVPNGNTRSVKVWGSFVGADGNLSVGATGGNGGTSTNPAYMLSGTGTDTLVFGVIFSGANTWSPTGRSGAQIFDRDLGAWGGGCQYRTSGTGGTTQISWLFGTSDDWGIVAGELLESPAGVTGNANLTQGSQMIIADGVIAVTANTTLTQGAQALSASAGVSVIGSAALVQGAQVLTASGTTQGVINADADLVQSAQSVTASAGVAIGGTLAQGQDAQVLTATGTVGITGSLTIVQSANGLSGTCAVRVTGAASVVQGNSNLAASGAVNVTGTAGVVQEHNSLVASASTGVGVIGNATLAQDAQVISASAQVTIGASANVTQAQNALGGLVKVVVAGLLAVSQVSDLAVGAGNIIVAGGLSATAAGNSISGDGSIFVSAVADIVQDDDALDAMILTRVIRNPVGVIIHAGLGGETRDGIVQGRVERVTLGASVEVEDRDGSVSLGR